MFIVQFTPAKVVEFSDPAQFEARARRFILSRETENSCLLGILPSIVQRKLPAIGFTIEEDGVVTGAGVFIPPSGSLVMTWATHEGLAALVRHASEARWRVVQTYAPAHCSHFFARDYSQATGQNHGFDRAERVYQLTRVTYKLPENGHLQVAVEGDLPLLCRWMQGFKTDAHFEEDGRTAEQMAAQMIAARELYLWKAPRAVSMAGWICPTDHGASISFVYTPPELRGRGYGKAVTAALSGQILASGIRYISIRADSDDAQTNAMYQGIGAQTVGEYMRCTIMPRVAPGDRSTAQSKPMVLL